MKPRNIVPVLCVGLQWLVMRHEESVSTWNELDFSLASGETR
jgi:hypothetical protein